jgi:hypothetical protein
VRHRALYPVALSRRLATAQSNHDGRNQNPRKGCAALVLITTLGAGPGQLGSGRRGCHRHHKRQSQRRELMSGFAVGRVARARRVRRAGRGCGRRCAGGRPTCAVGLPPPSRKSRRPAPTRKTG